MALLAGCVQTLGFAPNAGRMDKGVFGLNQESGPQVLENKGFTPSGALLHWKGSGGGGFRKGLFWQPAQAASAKTIGGGSNPPAAILHQKQSHDEFGDWKLHSACAFAPTPQSFA